MPFENEVPLIDRISTTWSAAAPSQARNRLYPNNSQSFPQPWWIKLQRKQQVIAPYRSTGVFANPSAMRPGVAPRLLHKKWAPSQSHVPLRLQASFQKLSTKAHTAPGDNNTPSRIAECYYDDAKNLREQDLCLVLAWAIAFQENAHVLPQPYRTPVRQLRLRCQWRTHRPL